VNTPADFFTPSARLAQSIDQEIRAALNSSIHWCIDQAQIENNANLDIPADWHAQPVDFGHYYSLVAALTSADSPEPDQLNNLIAALSNSSRGHFVENQVSHVNGRGFRITTLSQPWYNHSEIECLIRWFDIEAENGMGLAALTNAELKLAQSKLLTAINLIHDLLPDFMAEMSAITTEIIFAKPSGDQKMTFGGASSFSLWGGLALNSEAHSNWWLYIPRLVHEYSHNLLFGIARNEPLVLNDPEERYVSPLRGQPRPLDGIFHAAYVSAREALAMQQIIAQIDRGNTAQPITDLRPFFLQTLADSRLAFNDCHGVIQQHGRLSEIGKAVMHDTTSGMSTLLPV
jgi:hypothetical protein